MTHVEAHRRAPVRHGTSGRVMFALLAGTVTLAGWQFPEDGGTNLWYRVDVGGVGGQFLLALAILGLSLPLVLRTSEPSTERRLREAGLRGWALLAAGAVALALFRATLDGAPFLFADWLNLAVLAAVVALLTRWLATREWRDRVLLDLTLVTGVVATALLLRYAAGGGVELLGQRIPVFAGSHLQIATFAAMAGLSAWLHGLHEEPVWYARAVQASTLLCSLLVLLAFRRSFWMLWVLGIVGVVIVNRGRLGARRAQIGTAFVGVMVMGAVVVAVIGSDRITERIESFSPTSESTLASTNQDHYNDTLDALDVIAEDPLLGYGIGRFYQTQRIRGWKLESFDVHNAPLHAWLKFGLVGFVAYLGFHLQWVRFALRRTVPDGPARATSLAVGVFVLAELGVSLVGTWPYSSFHMSMHRAVLLAALLAFLPTARTWARA